MKKVFSSIILISIILINLTYAAMWKVTANPCPRTMSQMITDSSNQRIILFGGGNYRLSWGQYFNDVWSLDLNSEGWKLINLSTPMPGVRIGGPIVYDPVRIRMILFGGTDGTNFYNDVWLLNLQAGSETWVQLNPTGTPPTPRSDATAILDPINNRLIIFGGAFSSGTYVNETWALNLNNLTWAILSPSGALPPPRYAHTAIYDPSNNRMIVFGGIGASFYNDVWALYLTLNNESWQQIFPVGSQPDIRCRHFSVFDSRNHEMVIGFGYNFQGQWIYFNDVWALNLSDSMWHQIFPGGVSVAGRRGSCASHDPFNHRIFVFGGDRYFDYYFGDTYELDLDTLIAIQEEKESMHPYIKLSSNPSVLPIRINAFVPFPAEVCLKVIDGSGRVVNTLVHDKQNSGNYIIEWNGKNIKGQGVSSGIYYIILEIDGKSVSKKAVLIR